MLAVGDATNAIEKENLPGVVWRLRKLNLVMVNIITLLFPCGLPLRVGAEGGVSDVFIASGKIILWKKETIYLISQL